MQAEIKKYTYEEYAQLPEGFTHQLINGKLVKFQTPLIFHQAIASNILLSIMQYNSIYNYGYLFPSVDAYFNKHETYQPNIVFVSKERSAILKEKNIDGAPDLVIEILSESSAYYDLKHKKNIYEKYGVKEYWIVDPIDKSIEIYENIENKFHIFDQKKNSGNVKSKVLTGLQVEIESVFKP